MQIPSAVLHPVRRSRAPFVLIAIAVVGLSRLWSGSGPTTVAQARPGAAQARPALRLDGAHSAPRSVRTS
jgi:hypothetical protein